jgi:hypothetical protein
MAKDHVTALLDELLQMDGDGIAQNAVAEASLQTESDPGEFKVALVVADDKLGGWTNRYDYEFNIRFPFSSSSNKPGERPRWLKKLWITAVLWSSEPANEQAVREAIQTSVFRMAYLNRHGFPRTLRQKMEQEGAVMAMAGCQMPKLAEEEIEYTRQVLAPFMESRDKRTTIECLFGDAAGKSLGFTPRGLSPWAGLALALHDARECV